MVIYLSSRKDECDGNMRRKQLTEEMKAAVRAAAASLFTEKGYHSVTMREIAKEAGCSHTAIYLYFKDKEDLLPTNCDSASIGTGAEVARENVE